jgi:hypothetical protein
MMPGGCLREPGAALVSVLAFVRAERVRALVQFSAAWALLVVVKIATAIAFPIGTDLIGSLFAAFRACCNSSFVVKNFARHANPPLVVLLYKGIILLRALGSQLCSNWGSVQRPGF